MVYSLCVAFQKDIGSNSGAYSAYFPFLRDHSTTLTFVQCMIISPLHILFNFPIIYGRRRGLVPVTLLWLEAQLIIFYDHEIT